MNDEKKIDELLNGYLDGQLSQRRQTEAKRLLEHDPQIAERLGELKKFRNLLAALPHEDAPKGTLENIKSRLERRTLIGAASEENKEYDQIEGAKHLIWRKAISAAAMITLAVVLAAVIYVIVGPSPATDEPVFSDNWMSEEITPSPAAPVESTPLAKSEPTQPLPPVEITAQPEHLTAKLVLTTKMFEGVDAYVKRSLVDNGIMLVEFPMAQSKDDVYNLRCSRETLNNFVMDLVPIWDKFEMVTLQLQSGNTGQTVTVPNVTAGQIDLIITRDHPQQSLNFAKNIAALNTVTRDLPGTELAVEPTIDSLPIPKPVMTSPQILDKSPAKDVDESEMLDITIRIERFD